MTISGQGGTDPTKAIEQATFDAAKKVTREAMTVWNSVAQQRVMEAAEQRSGIDSEGREGRKSNALHEIAQEFTVPQWDPSEEKWVFAVTHAAAVFHEFGATPHEIRAKHARALAFEWPDAPEEIREKFEDTFPTVFFNSVQHPGVPAIGFLREGREQARQRLQDAGFDASGFGFGDDGGAD